MQFLHLRANLLFTKKKCTKKRQRLGESETEMAHRRKPVLAFALSTSRPTHTDYHTSADVTELGFLAVVVLELVGLVIDADNRVCRFWVLLLHLHLLIVDEIDLKTKKDQISLSKEAAFCASVGKKKEFLNVNNVCE